MDSIKEDKLKLIYEALMENEKKYQELMDKFMTEVDKLDEYDEIEKSDFSVIYSEMMGVQISKKQLIESLRPKRITVIDCINFYDRNAMNKYMDAMNYDFF